MPDKFLYGLIDEVNELNCPGCSFQTSCLYYRSRKDLVKAMQCVKRGDQPEEGLCAECISRTFTKEFFYNE